jgi:hypothetical protein
MKVMLDTNICVDIIRERRQVVLNRLKTHAIGDIGIPQDPRDLVFSTMSQAAGSPARGAHPLHES